MTDDFSGPKPMPRPEVIARNLGMNQPMPDDDLRATVDDQGRLVFTVNGMSAVLTQEMTDTLVARALPPQPGPTGIQAQVTVIGYENMGDCAAYVRKALTYDPDETVAALLTRAHRLGEKYRQHPKDGDRVELQIIPDTIPKAKPDYEDLFAR